MSSPACAAADAAPLLNTLHELHDIYTAYAGRAEDLIAALAANDFPAVQAAVAAQTALVRQIEQAERRRRAAVADLVAALTGKTQAPGAPRRTVTTSALLMLLPPDQADLLAGVRHDLLATLVRLQALQRRATALVRSAQTVVGRTLQASGGTPGAGYGSRGERALPRQDLYGPQGRWA